jgi:hypothetical protein
MKWQVRKARSLHQNYFSIMQYVPREMHSERTMEVIVEDGYERETSKLKGGGPSPERTPLRHYQRKLQGNTKPWPGLSLGA